MIKINKSILLGDDIINYLLTINPRAKHIKVSIGFEGLKVTIPKGVNIDFVETFLLSKKEWIIKHSIKYKEKTNNNLYYLGNEIGYNVLAGFNNNSIELKDNILNITSIKELNPDEIHLIIKEWYVKKATESFNESIKMYSKIMVVKFNRVCLRQQKTRWGSCSSKGNLNFNFKLIMAPRFVLDYIVVHELSHLIYMNHSKNYWLEVEKFLPDYKVAEKWLKLNHEKLNF